jgi:photosystem II stability/assembly factor-like uncharacterized protein
VKPPFLCSIATLAILFCIPAHAAEKWKAQFIYDEEKSVLNIFDLQFPSATRGVAVGVIREGSKEKPVALVTSNGGNNWQTIELQDTPVSLFFLNEGLGWLVTAKGGLWQTTEAGKNWRKLPRIPGPALHVYFTTEKDGWAAAIKKKVYETHDGGNSWTAVAAAAEPPGNADNSVYNWIAFATPKAGMIAGWNMPPRRTLERPEWLEPEAAAGRRDLPHLVYSLVTNDGGKTWQSGSASLFGQVARFRFSADGKGLGLIEHAPGFRYPSEVYKIDWQTGKNETVYRDRRFHVTDVWLTPGGTAYLAGSVSAGQMSLVPGKVQVLKSDDWKSWVETDVYYRAVANRVMLAAAGEDIWMATSEGMILKLVK